MMLRSRPSPTSGGFAAEIKRPVLAKLMLAERFAPEFYEQVARLAAAAPNGKSHALAHFEQGARVTEEIAKKPAKDERHKGAARPRAEELPHEVDEWSKSEWDKAWAAIDPPLRDEDLRPYVFVTRDKRTYLGGLAAASHLESLVDRLMGPRLSVQQALPEIRKLAGAEPEQVLDALCTRVTQGDQLLDTEPPGCAGTDCDGRRAFRPASASDDVRAITARGQARCVGRDKLEPMLHCVARQRIRGCTGRLELLANG